MIHRTCKGNSLIRISIAIPRTILWQDRRLSSYLRCLYILLGNGLLALLSGRGYSNNLDTGCGSNHSLNTHILTNLPLLFTHRYLSTSNIPSNNLAGFTTIASVSGIDGFSVLFDQSAPASFVHTATTRHFRLLSLSDDITESNKTSP